jgi:Fe-S cluster assembly ATP-binding protein
MLEIKNLTVSIENKKILDNLNLQIKPGEVHVLMGPNGSGKSTLAKSLIGLDEYSLDEGSILMDGEDLTEMDITDRARKGIFVAYQYPIEIPGVNLTNFLRMAYNSKNELNIPVFKFKRLLKEKLKFLDMSEDFLNRNLNEGFSGGEKKKSEMLQLAVLEPKYAILDETDSGLDVDAIKTVFEGVRKIIDEYKAMGVLIVTHYERVFNYIEPDFVHLMSNGRILRTGSIDLAHKILAGGYKNFVDDKDE